MLALLFAAGIAHAGWTQTDTDHGCTFYKGAQEASGATPVRVECDWDIDPGALSSVLSTPGDHHRIFGSLRDSETLGVTGGRERVRQVHKASGASDREVVVEVQTQSVDGGKRFSWRKSADQTGRKTDGVEPDLSEGYWEVTSTDGRRRLVYEIRYLAGGNVPAFLVRWFQGAGIKGVIGDLRTFMHERR
jgi:hypothetical protein